MVEGMSLETSELCAERRAARLNMIRNPEDAAAKGVYRTINKRVKSAVKTEKNENLCKNIDKMEEDFKANRSHDLFRRVK